MSSLLTATLLLPVLGAGAIALLPTDRRDWAPRLALGVTGLALLLMLAVALPFVPRGGWQYLAQAEWLPTLGIGYRLGMDGLGLHFALLSFLLGFAATTAAWRGKGDGRFPLAMLLLIQAGAALAFAARDLFLFFAGWQVALTAMAAVLARYAPGGVASRFRLFTGVASGLALAALLVLYMLNGAEADVLLLQQNHPAAVAPMQMQLLIFGVLAAGFAVQSPLAPWHPWFPDALEDLPAPVAALLAGVVAPLGTFGLIRFALAVMPGAAQYLSPAIVFLGLVSLLYGVWGGLASSGRRRAAYVAIAAAGATVAGLGSFQLVFIKAALFVLAAASMGIPAWILVSDASPRLEGARRKALVTGAILVVILWPILTMGLLGGFASSFAPLLGL